MQLIIVGKVAGALVLAWDAYKDYDDFRKETGLEKVRLIYEKKTDTTVCPITNS